MEEDNKPVETGCLVGKYWMSSHPEPAATLGHWPRLDFIRHKYTHVGSFSVKHGDPIVWEYYSESVFVHYCPTQLRIKACLHEAFGELNQINESFQDFSFSLQMVILERIGGCI